MGADTQDRGPEAGLPCGACGGPVSGGYGKPTIFVRMPVTGLTMRALDEDMLSFRCCDARHARFKAVRSAFLIDYVRNPANGYYSPSLDIDDGRGNEFTVRIG